MNPTTANYNEPWKEALSHLENGFLEETRFLCVFAATNSVKKPKLTIRRNALPLLLNWCVMLSRLTPYWLIFVSLWL